MSAGTYCDILTGGKSGATCAGTSLTVDGTGAVQLVLPSNTAVAILASSKL